MTRIYYALGYDSMNGRGTILGLEQFGILISAAALWQARKPKLWRPNLPPHGESIMDSGAFAILKWDGFKGYPFGLDEYLDAACDLDVDWVAAQDWPCEPTSKIPFTVRERVDKTVLADSRLIDRVPPGSGPRPLPVIQGWTVDDYLYCADELRAYGLLQSRIAVGSCCGRSDMDEVERIATALRSTLPGWVRLHFFGLGVRALSRPAIRRAAFSIDTGAWQYWTDEPYIPFIDGRCRECGKAQDRPDGPGHLHRAPGPAYRTHQFYNYRRVVSARMEEPAVVEGDW